MTTDNPFSPPAANLENAPAWVSGTLVPDGRILPASQGWQWIRESVLMVASAPLTWFLITFTFMAIGIALSVVPLVSLLWNVAVPIALGGVMMGCQALDRGQRLELQHLFAAARAPFLQPLAMVGVLYLAGSLIAIMTVMLLAGVAMVGVIAVVGAEQAEAQPLLVGAGVALLVLIMLLVTVALSMTLWFSPALVTLGRLQPLEAMRLSLRGCSRNMAPFLVYGLVLLGVLLLAALVGGGFTLAGGMLIAPDQISIPIAAIGGAVMAALCGLLLAPSFWCAMYASYRDVFVA